MVGGLLGWASGLRATGRRPHRELVLAPAAFAAALLDRDIRRSLVTNGQGSRACRPTVRRQQMLWRLSLIECELILITTTTRAT